MEIITFTDFPRYYIKGVRRALFCLMALYSLLVSCGPSTVKFIPSTETLGAEMINLTIDLQDGFGDDTVILLVDGKEIFQKEHVSTKLLLGLADSIRTDVEKGQVRVEINIQTRNLTETILVDASAPVYVGISIESGKITYIVSPEPFGYG